MRRLGDLDSNNWVAHRPYCNGRAIAFDKVLKRRKPIACGAEEKTGRGRKASVVGFRRPDSGTRFPRARDPDRAPDPVSNLVRARKIRIMIKSMSRNRIN